MKLALKLFVAGFALFGQSTAVATELVCFLVSSIELELLGQKIEHKITDPDEITNPEHYYYFNLNEGKTILFWSDTDDQKIREEEELLHANGPLYYSRYQSDDGDLYSTYVFKPDFSGGVIIEGDYVYSIHCQQTSLEEVEKKHGIPFSEFRHLE